MKKYFVQSGKIKKVIFAADSHAAALWLINIVMDRLYPNHVQAEMNTDPFELFEEAFTFLGTEVFVSQSGFVETLDDQTDSTRLETIDVVAEWNELVAALAKMEKMLLGQSRIELCELAS